MEPPHSSAATSKNTADAGRIFDLGAKCFQTLFSGLKDEMPAQQATDTTVDFPERGEGGRAVAGTPPVSPPAPPRPSPPPRLARSGPSLRRARAGERRRAARAPHPGPRRRLGSAGQQGRGRGARGEDPPAGALGARASALGWCARAAPPRPPGARLRQPRSPPPRPARTGWIRLTPLPRAAAAAGAE